MLSDQSVLRKRLGGLQRASKQGRSIDAVLARIQVDILSAQQRRAARAAGLPTPDYPEQLPVSERREEIKRAIAAHQVVIVAGETGSGKTTLLPKICLELGRGVSGLIGHTQPRRIAARTLAARIASELNSHVGRHVGYKVRFSDHTSPDSYVKIMTDGILLAEIQGDRELCAYDTLIIDEAHERSLNIDFLLGYLRELLPRRPDLKVIITSATIDTARFSNHFTNAPVIEVSGRSYPVEMRYRPLLSEEGDEQDRDIEQAIIDAVDELGRLDRRGDILIFLPGEREIRQVAEALRKHHPPGSEILALYSRQSTEEQNQVFQPSRGRRIVLTTNVAETSLTVPGIRYVVDTGLARISRYSYRAKVQRLQIEPISRASANQRAGRCGRVAPGVCIRLYAEQDFNNRVEFTDPEIRRTNLASVILQMQMLGLGEVDAFPFIDGPDSRAINDGYRLLQELGSVDASRRITDLGHQLSRFPLDPRLGRMLIAAVVEGCVAEVLVIVAALSVQDPRDRPQEYQQKADLAHQAWRDERSDFFSYLRLWQAYAEQQRHLTRNKLRQWCKSNFISYTRMHEWLDIHHQLSNQIKDMGVKPNVEDADYLAIHRALLAGLLGHLGIKQEKDEYLGARNSRFHLFPGSGIRKKAPRWVMAAEIVETTRLFARTAAGIEPEWIEQVAGDLCKRSYSDPHWEKRRAQVVALEKLTLYGLPVVVSRKIHYGPIDPVVSREIFIREALVAGELTTRAAFFSHNRQLLEEVQQIEDRTRRRDVVVDDLVLFSFYDQRIPQHICNGAAFERWRKRAEAEQPGLLFLALQDLMQQEAALDTQAYPDFLLVAGAKIPLSYHFVPGEENDGVTAQIAIGLLNSLSPQAFEWLVPGMLNDKIQFLLKALPKLLRKNFVPVPHYARSCAEAMAGDQRPLLDSLIHQLLRLSGLQLSPTDWQDVVLPDHLRMRFAVQDLNGNTIATGRDLEQLKRELASHALDSLSAAAPVIDWERTGLTQWEFDTLPEQMEITRAGVTLLGYPALVDEGQSVALRLLESAPRAAVETAQGLLRLYLLQSRDKVKYLRKHLPQQQTMTLLYASIGSAEQMIDDILAVAARQAFHIDCTPSNKADFQARLAAGQLDLVTLADATANTVLEVLQAYQQVKKAIKNKGAPQWLIATQDIQQQLSELIYPHFIAQTPPQWLECLPRYLKGIQMRIDKLGQNFALERERILELQKLWQQYVARREKHARNHEQDQALVVYRWMLEEYRVSLFAQTLKTSLPVSAKRLEKQWELVRP